MEQEKVKTDRVYDWTYVQNFILDIIDLKKGVDKKAVIEEIKAKKSMSGANAWMLMCSIIIASIGLDQNSDAVIIGAMLISPLMSPILGIGLGIGINDKEVLKKAFVHFSVAIIIAIATSWIYFALTPFGDITPAIAARTAPNTLDVLVAIFGGLAGIISIARKDISTTLPGVAIATALMPPLCVAGYGLAKGDFNFALNAFYLFILNTSFICISTYVIVRFLRFPYRQYLNKKERYRNRLIVVLFGLLIIIPSFFLLSNVLQQINTQRTIKDFIENDFGDNKIYLDGYTILESDTISTLVLKVYGDAISPDNEMDYIDRLEKKGLPGWNVQIIKSSEVDLNKIKTLEEKIQEIRFFAETEQKAQVEKLSLLQTKEQDSTLTVQLKNEISTLYDEVDKVSFGRMNLQDNEKFNTVHTVLIDLKENKKLSKENRERLIGFLEERINIAPLRIFIND